MVNNAGAHQYATLAAGIAVKHEKASGLALFEQPHFLIISSFPHPSSLTCLQIH